MSGRLSRQAKNSENPGPQASSSSRRKRTEEHPPSDSESERKRQRTAEDEEEEPEDEEGEEYPEHDEDDDSHDAIMSGSGSAMHQAHLLMKHVSELGMLLPGLQGGRINTIAQRLDRPDEGEQFQALTELCDLLSMSTEEALIGFRVETLLPGLLRCMQNEANQEMMLLGCRALSHLMDALPGSVASIVNANAVPILIEKLLNMQVIDLAEQALLCLEKICHDHALRVLSEGGMGAMLTFVDFFSLPLQRKIVSSICNMVRKVPSPLFSFVEDCLPQLSLLLTYEDAKLVESTCLTLHRLVCSFQDDEDKLAKIGSEGMLSNLIIILQRGVDLITPNAWSIILKTLTVLAKRSVSRTTVVLHLDAHHTLLGVLRTQAEAHSLSAEGVAAAAPTGSQQSSSGKGLSHGTIGEVVELLRVMLPVVDTGLLSVARTSLNYYSPEQRDDGPQMPLSREHTAASQESEGGASMPKAYSWHYERADGEQAEEDEDEEDEDEDEDDEFTGDGPRPGGGRLKVQRTDTSDGGAGGSPVMQRARKMSDAPVFNAELHEARKELYVKTPELLEQFAAGIPALMAVHGASVHSYGKAKSLAAVTSIIHHSPPELLLTSLRDIPVSAFIASLLRQGEVSNVLAGLHLAHRLIEKQPVLFAAHFIREGVTAEIEQLLKDTETDASGSPPEDASGELSAERFNTALIRGSCDDYLSKCAGLVDPSRLGNGPKLLEVIRNLEKWCGAPGGAIPHEEEGSKHLNALCDLLRSEDGVSTFEFATSRLVPVVLRYLCATGDGGEEGGSGSGVPSGLRLGRAKRFLAVFLTPAPAGGAGGLCGGDPQSPGTYLTVFIHRLVLALQHYERLPVYATEKADRGGGWASALKALTQPFRLMLTREKDAKEEEGEAEPVKGTTAGGPPSSSSVTVIIEPLATIAAVEDFVTTKLCSRGGGPTCTAEEGEQRHFAVHRHKLTKSSQKARAWTCDRCHAPFSGPGPTRWRCEQCDFDICGVCAPVSQPGKEKDKKGAAHPAHSSSSASSSSSSSQKASQSRPESGGKKRTSMFPFRKRSSKDSPADSKSAQGTPSPSPEQAAAAAAAAASSSSSSSSSAAAASAPQAGEAPQAPPAGPSVSIYLDGVKLPSHLTIFSAIYSHRAQQVQKEGAAAAPQQPVLRAREQDVVINTRSIWGKVYKLMYRAGDAPAPQGEGGEAQPPSASPSPAAAAEAGGAAQGQGGMYSTYGSDCLGAAEYVECCAEPFPGKGSSLLDLPQGGGAAGGGGGGVPDATEMLRLMQVLRAMCVCGADILERPDDSGAQIEKPKAASLSAGLPSEMDFRAKSISNKLLKQMLDGLLLCTGQLSRTWCADLVYHCPFLFSFSTRLAFFELTSFGPTRSVIRLQEVLQEEGEECKFKVGRVQKQKIQLERDAAFKSAKRVMSLYGSQRSFLEFEFIDEVGTGLGPTLEFYTLVSRGIQQDEAGLFMKAEGSSFGLFPKPLPPPGTEKAEKERAELLAHCKFIGTFIARAIYDKRMADVPLSPPLLKALCGRRFHPSDLRFVSPGVFKSVQAFQELARQRDAIVARHGGDASSPACREEVESTVLMSKAKISDLSLGFTLPGYPDVPLKEGGDDVAVTVWNMDEYALLVCECFLSTSIAEQVQAMIDGANDVFTFSRLRCFSTPELDLMLCGSSESFTIEGLEAATVCDHGYTQGSKAIKMLFSIMSRFDALDMRKFLTFVTGAPRLPVGGLQALKPRFTVVRKTSDGAAVDTVLPSVMTCQNYLKIPDYSSEEVMEARLRFAMTEGAESFHLS